MTSGSHEIGNDSTEAEPQKEMRLMQPGDRLPTYQELQHNPTLDMRASWDVFGQGDELGTQNLITSEVLVAASREIERGQRFCLSLPLNQPDPSISSRKIYTHNIFSRKRNQQDDFLDGFFMQYSSHWDGLRHYRAREFGYYGGVDDEGAGPQGDRLSISRWAERGIVGRGVLLDVAGFLKARHGRELDPVEEFSIEPGLLQEVARAEELEIRSGDILMLRTGFIASYLKMSPDDKSRAIAAGACPGLAAHEGMAQFLWDSQFSAVVADNSAVEVKPGDTSSGFLHRRLIPMLGFALGELFTFEDLAADCQEDGRYSCFFVAVPLNLPGGVGSPANAVAIK